MSADDAEFGTPVEELPAGDAELVIEEDAVEADAPEVLAIVPDDEVPAPDPAELRAEQERRAERGFYVDPQTLRDIDGMEAAAAEVLPDVDAPAPDVYIDPLDGTPAKMTVAPAGQVLITHPDLPGEPVGACAPEAFDETYAARGWVLVDDPATSDNNAGNPGEEG